MKFKARLYLDGKPTEKITEETLIFNKATNKDITLLTPYRSRLSSGGERALIDGLTGSSIYFDGKWQGYEQHDLKAVIDLGERMPIHKITINFYQHIGGRIFFPKEILFSLSEDNAIYRVVATFKNKLSHDDPLGSTIESFEADLKNEKARYVHIISKNRGWCPDWHWRPGNTAFILADEIY